MENELRRYSAIVWRWAWLIALGAVLAAAAAYITSRLTSPVYAASATLLVNEAPNGKTADYSSILTSERLAQTYSEMMTKRPILDEVISKLKLNVAPDELAKRISVNLVRDTQLIELQVEDEDPQRAAAIANSVPTEFSAQNAELQANRYADSKANLTTEMDALKAQIDQKQSEINALGTPTDANTQNELSRLQSDLTQLRQSSAYLLQSYEAIRLAEAQSTSNIVVVEPANVPDIPVRPRTFQNTVLGGIVGAMLALGIVFLIEYLDDRVRSPEQISRVLGVPIVGLIARWSFGSHNGNDASALIAVNEPRSPIVEAFRALRTNIQFAGVDQAVRTLLVTSAGPAEGKSTVAGNLAIVIAQAGPKVVLIDADLRRPTVHHLFEQPNRVGLTNLLLQEQSQWDKAVQLTPQTANLSVVPSGPLPPNPSELLGSKRMRQFLTYLHESYDVVIIDAPPLLPVTDAAVLSQLVDGVLLVVDTGTTRIGEATQGKLQLEQVGARLLGVVMNKIPVKRRGYSYYSYHYHYDYDDAHKNSKRVRSRRIARGVQAGESASGSETPMPVKPRSESA